MNTLNAMNTTESAMLPVGAKTATNQKVTKTADLPNMPTLEALEKEYMAQVLKAVGDNKAKAALVLGVSIKTVYNKIKKYGLSQT